MIFVFIEEKTKKFKLHERILIKFKCFKLKIRRYLIKTYYLITKIEFKLNYA